MKHAAPTLYTPVMTADLVEEGWVTTQLRLRVLQGARWLCRLFYRYELDFMGCTQKDAFKDVRMVMVLNHTSLFEPLWLGAFPPSFIRAMSKRFVYPIASSTLAKLVPGITLRMLAKTIPVTRKRDDSWKEFMGHVQGDSIIGICPEGRMKRPNGLDRNGEPMSVRGGVAEVLQALPRGKIVVLYSGGLHHVFAPGARFPKLFKVLKAKFHSLDIETYRQELMQKPGDFRDNVIKDLQQRIETHCP